MKLDKKQIINKLAIKDKMTILVMGGGLGLGAINGIVRELDNKYNDIQILAIAGRNERLELRLRNIKAVNDLTIYGLFQIFMN